MNQSDLLDVSEAAEFLGLNDQTIRRLARENKIPAFKYGGSWRFQKEKLIGFNADEPILQLQSEKKNVLIIDDDPRIVKIMRKVIETEGHTVTTCFNGEKVVEQMEGVVPDIIFLDLQMPLYSGPKTYRLILEHWGRIETVVLTAFPDSDLMQEMLELGSIRLLKKPPDLAHIIECVNNIHSL